MRNKHLLLHPLGVPAEKGLAQGMEKGMSQRSLEIARTMLAKGMDAEMVMEITGLSESQLKQLKE